MDFEQKLTGGGVKRITLPSVFCDLGVGEWRRENSRTCLIKQESL